jgi:hypothetical protein
MATRPDKSRSFARGIAIGAIRFREQTAVVLWVRLKDALCAQSE